jgi:two-component system, NarL family, sensor kinase
MRYKIIFIIACSLINLHSMAQINSDSLRKVISLENDNRRKVANLIKLCEQFRYSNSDSLLGVTKELMQIGKQYNDEAALNYANYFIAMYYNLSGNPDTAYAIASKGIPVTEKMNNPTLAIKLYALAGNCLMRMNRQKDALQIFYTALQKSEDAKDEDGELKAFNNIGWAYMELEQYKKAIANFKESLLVSRRNSDMQNKYPTIYNNLASCFGSLGMYDSVYLYAPMGIRVATIVNDYAALANGYSIMGTFLSKQERYKEALIHFSKAISIREKTADPFFIVSDLAEISDLQSKTKDYKEGIENALKALTIARQNDIKAKLPIIYTALAHNYEESGNFTEALAVYKKLNSIKDSMYNDANPKALAEIQTKYETVKQQQEIQQQRNRIQQQKFLFLGTAAVLILAGLLGYSYFRRNKFREEAKRKIELLNQQRNAEKAIKEAEENERQRISRDLHDSIGAYTTALISNVQQMKSTGQAKEIVEKMEENTSQLLSNLREIIWVLNNKSITLSDLSDTFKSYCFKLTQNFEQINFEAKEEIENNNPLSSVKAIHIYKILQEGFQNILKHSNATKVQFLINSTNNKTTICLHDNGDGFTQSAVKPGNGLENMEWRAKEAEYLFQMETAPGKGTMIKLSEI